MRKQLIAMLDTEVLYAERLMNYVNEKRTSPFELVIFTRYETLLAYMSGHRLEILLVGEHMLARLGKETEKLQIIVLAEERDSDTASYPSVYKYQKAQDLIREIVMICGDPDGGSAIWTVTKTEPKLIGVFSPCGRCGKTLFALAAGRQMAVHKAVLFLDLHPVSGISAWIGRRPEASLTEALYHIRKAEDSKAVRAVQITALAEEYDGMAFLGGASAQDLYGTGEEDYLQLFRMLMASSAYERIVVDFGQIPLMYPKLLQECDLLFMPVTGDPAALRRDEELADLLQSVQVIVDERVRRLHFPEMMECGQYPGIISSFAADALRREGL